jgi:hypothetical protein
MLKRAAIVAVAVAELGEAVESGIIRAGVGDATTRPTQDSTTRKGEIRTTLSISHPDSLPPAVRSMTKGSCRQTLLDECHDGDGDKALRAVSRGSPGLLR